MNRHVSRENSLVSQCASTLSTRILLQASIERKRMCMNARTRLEIFFRKNKKSWTLTMTGTASSRVCTLSNLARYYNKSNKRYMTYIHTRHMVGKVTASNCCWCAAEPGNDSTKQCSYTTHTYTRVSIHRRHNTVVVPPHASTRRAVCRALTFSRAVRLDTTQPNRNRPCRRTMPWCCLHT